MGFYFGVGSFCWVLYSPTGSGSFFGLFALPLLLLLRLVWCGFWGLWALPVLLVGLLGGGVVWGVWCGLYCYCVGGYGNSLTLFLRGGINKVLTLNIWN